MRRWAHIAALAATTVLWGTSFPAIKIVASGISSYAYTWGRGSLAAAVLGPYIAYLAAKGLLRSEWVRGGLLAGVAYSLGIFFQGWGTSMTTASSSAFITGMNVVFVHAYQALRMRAYSPYLAASLVLAIPGLWALTSPTTGFGLGDALVLVSAVFWAAQVIIIDKYSRSHPAVLAYFMILPSTAFAVPASLTGSFARHPTPDVTASLAYLAIACTVTAFTLQAYGQKGVAPAAAATIFLGEPVIAAIASYIVLGEAHDLLWAAGAGMILSSIALATLHEVGKQPGKLA